MHDYVNTRPGTWVHVWVIDALDWLSKIIDQCKPNTLPINEKQESFSVEITNIFLGMVE